MSVRGADLGDSDADTDEFSRPWNVVSVRHLYDETSRQLSQAVVVVIRRPFLAGKRTR